jgi:hypothetical protein
MKGSYQYAFGALHELEVVPPLVFEALLEAPLLALQHLMLFYQCVELCLSRYL